MKRELMATATFGLEACVKREIQALGYEIIGTENGHVAFLGDERAIARCNLWLRCADRVLLVMGQFPAETFEDLFQQTKGIAWEELIPPDGKFTVIGSSVKSRLHSVPACQSIVKKAVAERLGECYGMDVLTETGAEHRIKVSLLKDKALLTVDTSGTALHKRGYREADVAAPIKETMAAALIQLSFWKPGRVLLDPCCGSGTIPIEAALIGRNIAPGLSRHFAAEDWDLMDSSIWKEERRAAYAAIQTETPLEIYASDIDPRAAAATRTNAAAAGVEDCIRFSRADLSLRENLPEEGGIMISNLPYGKRIGSETGIRKLYQALGRLMKESPRWSFFLLTSDKGLEKALRRKADRRRKLFNGNIETTYYQYHGKR